MAYKSILTIATTPVQVDLVIAAAARVSYAHDAHLTALALGVDRSQVGYADLGSGAVVLQINVEHTEKETRDIETALQAAMKLHGRDLRSSIDSIIAQAGVVADVVADHARYADLVVLPKPYGPDAAPETETLIEASLFEGMAPVLVVPDSGLIEERPKVVVLAWDQSREALVAARRALPLLRKADQVVVTVIDPPSHGPEHADPGRMLCRLLVRHGVKAEVSVLARTLPNTSDMLARQCQDVGADLLVMGAYGHSRLRQAILGGTTRNTLENAEVPLFMAH